MPSPTRLRQGGGAEMERLSRGYGAILTFFAAIAGVLLFVMMLLICADVLPRNLPAAGFATPTEVAAVGAFATLLLAMAYRALSVKNLWRSLRGSVAISGMILFIIVAATTFSQVLGFSGGTPAMIDLIGGSGLSPAVVLAIMMAVLIFLGLFVDQVSTMLLTLPFFMPVVKRPGIDETRFGVMFLMCMQLGLLLPPHGMPLYTMKSVAPKHIRMGRVFVAVTPYVIFSMLLLAAIFFFPAIATWFPNAVVG